MLICAIPGCSASQSTLQSGRLHLIDTPLEANPAQSRKKYVWLCSSCSATHVVQTWRVAGEQIQRRRPLPTLPFPVQPETADPGRPYLLEKRLA
jgi:hypothetical protein